MAITISNVYVQTFESNLRHLAQQSDTRLRKFVTEASVQSEKHNWERLGAGDATQKTSARTATPTSDLPWSRRVSIPQTWHTGETVEQEDPVQMLVDPNSNVAKSLAMAMRRKIDDIIVTAATADALDGDGSTMHSFPAGQVVGGATTVIDIDPILEVQEKFISNDIDPDEPKVMIIGPKQQRKLLQIVEVVSADYQAVKALATGHLPNFMGFTWVVSNRLLAPGAGEISCLAFTKRALGLQVNKDIWARVAERADLSFAWHIYTAMTMGAVRVEDEHIVHFHLKDAMS